MEWNRGWANEGNKIAIRDWLLSNGCNANICEAAAFGRVVIVCSATGATPHAPRTFCLSPFGDNHLFIGGHDSTSLISDDMAGIFGAPMDVALGVAPGFSASPPSVASSPEARLLESPVYELRIYVADKGRFQHLLKRFCDHTTRFFNRHGIENVAYWTPFDKPKSNNTLIYLIHHASRKQADANWKAFNSDPEWRKVARESQIDGRFLVQPPDRIYLKAMAYSPLK